MQSNLDGQLYYVDPTRNGQSEALKKLPTAFPGAAVLVIDKQQKELITLPERTDPPPQYEHVEHIVIASLDGDAKLETRKIYRGNYAGWARLRYLNLSVNEQKKDMLSLYEKQYPGVSLLEVPS